MVGGLAVPGVYLALALPAGAQVEVQVPAPLPAVELPAVPVPVPVPQVTVPPVTIPAPVPAVPVVNLPAVPAVTPAVPDAPTGAASVSRVGQAVETAASDRSGPGDEGADPGARKRRRGIHGTRYRQRDRLVRGLRGCLDRLSRPQRSALILRYGIGRVDARSARRAADVMDVSRTRFRRLERRGVRRLAASARGSSCERTGVSGATYAAVYRLIERESSGGVRLAFALLAGESSSFVRTSAPVSEGAAEGGVAGARESGGSGDGEDGDSGASGGPALPTPLGDLRAAPDSPLFLLFLALALAAAAFAARSIVRAVR